VFVPGRHARLNDLIINAVAACIGVVTSSLLSGLLSLVRNALESTPPQDR
jgi:VanZ family protein